MQGEDRSCVKLALLVAVINAQISGSLFACSRKPCFEGPPDHFVFMLSI